MTNTPLYTLKINNEGEQIMKLIIGKQGPIGPQGPQGPMQNQGIKDYGAIGNGTANDTNAIINALNAANGDLVYVPEGTYKVNDNVDLSRLYGPGNITSASTGDFLRRGFFLDTLAMNDENGGISTLPKRNSLLAMLDLRLHEDSDKNSILNLLFRPDPTGNVKDSVVLHLYGEAAKGPQIDVVSNQAGLSIKQARNPNIAPELGNNYVGTGGSIVMSRAGDGSAPNSAGSPYNAQARTTALYKHQDIIFKGKTFFGDYCKEWSGLQNGFIGNGNISNISAQDKELKIEVTGADNLYLSARAQLRCLSGIALNGQDTTAVPPCTAPSIYRDNITQEPVWYNTLTNKWGKLSNENIKGLIVESSTNKTYTGNAYDITHLTTPSVNQFDALAFNNGIFTVPTGLGGWYDITASADWTGDLFLESIMLKINGINTYKRGMGRSPDANWKRYLSEGDTIQLVAYNAAGGSQTLVHASLEILRLSE